MDGTRLEVHGTLGRVVVATRSFAPGEAVMAEQPLIVFDASPGASPESYLQAFASAPSLVQASVLDMFHPPLDKDTPVVVARRRVANGLDGIFGLSKELIHKLLLIRDTNCLLRGHGWCIRGRPWEFNQGSPLRSWLETSTLVLPQCVVHFEKSARWPRVPRDSPHQRR